MNIKRMERLFTANADKEDYSDRFWAACSRYGRDFGIKTLRKEAKQVKSIYGRVSVYRKLYDLAKIRVISTRFAVKIYKILFGKHDSYLKWFIMHIEEYHCLTNCGLQMS